MKILLSIIFILAIGGSVFAQTPGEAVPAQTSDEKPVKLLRGVTTKSWNCNKAVETVYTPETLRQLIDTQDCDDAAELKTDFAKESLIGFSTYGDCHVRALAKITRNDRKKTFTVETKTIGGGCRAAGRFHGWLVIEKIPADYKVVQTHSTLYKNETDWIEEELIFMREINKWSAKYLPVESYDIKGCINLKLQGLKLVVSDQAFFDRLLTNRLGEDAGCKKRLAKIDFTKHSLLGLHMTTGYCRVPSGLKPYVMNNIRERQYHLFAVYLAPQGVCRHIGGHDMWVLVPKLPEGFGVEFSPLPLDKENYEKYVMDLDKMKADS